MTALMQQAGRVAQELMDQRLQPGQRVDTLTLRLLLAEAYSIGVRDGQQREKKARRKRA